MTAIDMIVEVRRTVMIMSALRASIILLDDCDPDLTVGAISCRRNAPFLG